MASTGRLIRIYGENKDGQWSLINLEFSLAAQAESFDEAKILLDEQIKQYLHDALGGLDREHAPALLGRRAPAKYWFKFCLRSLISRLFSYSHPHQRSITQTVSQVPAASK